MKKNFLNAIVITLLSSFVMMGCAEPRYYRTNNRHSDRYYDRHPHRHRANVDVRIHN